jgi:SpoVK/Ycf46/Vps4 family AAA+-type ATPase
METEQKLETEYHWSDLVLNKSSLELLLQLRECGKVQQSCTALFYGPPGTGKSLSAALLGKELGKEVIKIDLSAVVSKYIGETEKNLENVFAHAEDKDWILFFDEADALFGKRTDVKDSHDKYANQEISYLLQRIESYNGLVILATNMKNNIDDEFIRRLRFAIEFPIPEPAERLQLWEKAFILNKRPPIEDLQKVSQEFELTGASIMSLVQELDNDAFVEDKDRIIEKIRRSKISQ